MDKNNLNDEKLEEVSGGRLSDSGDSIYTCCNCGKKYDEKFGFHYHKRLCHKCRREDYDKRIKAVLDHKNSLEKSEKIQN